MADYSKQFKDMKSNIIDRMAQRGAGGGQRQPAQQNQADPVVQALKNVGAKRKVMGNNPGRRL